MSTDRCRALAGLEHLTEERVLELMTPGPRYAPSTIKKHEWAIRIFVGYCHHLKVVSFPLQEETIFGFIKYLGKLSYWFHLYSFFFIHGL